MKIPEDVGLQKQLTEIHVQEWYKDDLFQLRWWILIAMTIIVIILWWILVKKSRLLEVSLYTALASIVFMGINEYGEELSLWDYPVDIIAIYPPLSSVNMFILPLLFSLIYQYYTARKSFIIASLVATGAMCFIIEPIFALSGLYELVNWKHYESFPVYFLAAITVRAAVIKIYKILEKHRINMKQSM